MSKEIYNVTNWTIKIIIDYKNSELEKIRNFIENENAVDWNYKDIESLKLTNIISINQIPNWLSIWLKPNINVEYKNNCIPNFSEEEAYANIYCILEFINDNIETNIDDIYGTIIFNTDEKEVIIKFDEEKKEIILWKIKDKEDYHNFLLKLLELDNTNIETKNNINTFLSKNYNEYNNY